MQEKISYLWQTAEVTAAERRAEKMQKTKMTTSTFLWFEKSFPEGMSRVSA